LRLLGFVLIVSVLALFIYVSNDLPDRGTIDAPANVHLAPEFTELAEDHDVVGVPNLVSAVLADFRGYDTLGETIVIFTGGLAVLLVLTRRRRHDDGTS
jgi:multicomponent Na+:H+ antiporter subunit B